MVKQRSMSLKWRNAMKKHINFFIKLFFLLDAALFCFIMIYTFSSWNGVNSEPNLKETLTSSDNTSIITIYDETQYINHEPLSYSTSIKYNGEYYAAFMSNYDGRAYDIEQGDEYVDILYNNRFRLRIRR